MHYLLLIYGTEAAIEAIAPAQRDAMMKDFDAFTLSLIQGGTYRAGERLHPTRAATTVRMNQGKATATDGPFAETKEQLGGYFLIEARDLDEAIGVAQRVPSVRFGGSVEIRPVLPVNLPERMSP